MKKKYYSPEMELEKFLLSCSITTSTLDEGGNEGGGGGDDWDF
jgi:hypothetical protein